MLVKISSYLRSEPIVNRRAALALPLSETAHVMGTRAMIYILFKQDFKQILDKDIGSLSNA
ncbi:hypothetical protein CEQ90_20355 [Lewinellaceae bacterium SD302]|nr:hypothetical protein CEQ90_20355 [Lewinellaceae bacterium SD302]